MIDYNSTDFERVVGPVDFVIDTVGGDTSSRLFSIMRPGGILVSVVSSFAPGTVHNGIRARVLPSQRHDGPFGRDFEIG